MPEEIWKDIKDYEGLYQVSNLGRVKALAREYTAGNGAKRNHNDIIMKPGKNDHGYFHVALHKDGKRKGQRVHKLVIQSFIGESTLEVNHINGIKSDNSLDNLEYCTRSENIKHAFRTGLIIGRRDQNGEKNNSAKLKSNDIILIRKLWEEYHIKQKTIACLFNVNPPAINDIIKRRNWKHVS